MAEFSLHGPYGDEALKPDNLDAYLAAYQLLDTQPQASAGHRLLPPLALVAGPGVFAVGLVLLAPQLAITATLCALYVYIASLVVLRLAAALLPRRATPAVKLTQDQLPAMSVIVAMYRESEVVAGLCNSLSRLNYPRDRLEILLVLESGDDDTIKAARAAARRHGFQVLIAPPCGPQTKPRALNYALRFASGDFVAVYDAEDSPSRNQLWQAAERFAANPRLGVVQAPLGWYNARDCWLTRQFALEYAAQFHGILPLFSRLETPLPLGGTSNVFRMDALQDSGGWDPFNVTEDADLGFRLAVHGWQAGLVPAGTAEEAPTTLKAWTGQRSRWLKGHLITWLVQMRHPRALIEAAGWRGFWALQVSLLANVFSALAQLPGLILITAGLVMALTGTANALTWIGLGFGLTAWAASILCLWRSARRAGVGTAPGDLSNRDRLLAVPASRCDASLEGNGVPALCLGQDPSRGLHDPARGPR